MAEAKVRRRIALGITGASGVCYGLRVLRALLERDDIETHLIVSPSAVKVFLAEHGLRLDPMQLDRKALGLPESGKLVVHAHENIGAGPASGSFRLEAMAIVPCSMGCVAAIAHGLSDNLVERAADVMLKERRKLVVVPRETPLSSIHLRNLLALSENGAMVLPAAPGFYGRPASIDELVDFIAGRVLDHLGIGAELGPRWNG